MKLKRIIAVMLVVLTLGTTTALAGNQDFAFVFTNTTSQPTTPNPCPTKNDNDQNWYISLDTTYIDGLPATMSASNIFGAKIHKASGTSVSNYFTFTSYGNGIKKAYNTTVATNDAMYMQCKKDSTSTSSAALYISGRWCP